MVIHANYYKLVSSCNAFKHITDRLRSTSFVHAESITKTGASLIYMRHHVFTTKLSVMESGTNQNLFLPKVRRCWEVIVGNLLATTAFARILVPWLPAAGVYTCPNPQQTGELLVARRPRLSVWRLAGASCRQQGCGGWPARFPCFRIPWRT